VSRRASRAQLLAAALLLAALPGHARLRPMVGLTAGRLSPRDADFRAVYGSPVVLGGVRAGVRVHGGYYLWGAFQFARRTGRTVPVLGAAAVVDQRVWSAGVGFREPLAGRLGYKLELCAARLRFGEKAFGQKATGAGTALCGEAGLTWRLARRLGLEATVAYVNSGDSDSDTLRVLGGWRTGVGLQLGW
jgi:hypothetical protein